MSIKAAKASDRTGEADLHGRPAATMRRRGACPALAAPMATGDGLLVRLRPVGGALTLSQFASLARSAAAHGNGILEITARGNLQIRGLRAETVGQLAADIDAAGITVPEGLGNRDIAAARHRPGRDKRSGRDGNGLACYAPRSVCLAATRAEAFAYRRRRRILRIVSTVRRHSCRRAIRRGLACRDQWRR